jgi:hypothetical protein
LERKRQFAKQSKKDERTSDKAGRRGKKGGEITDEREGGDFDTRGRS